MPNPPSERIIFIVVDPAQDKPFALKRALLRAEKAVQNQRVALPKFHVFVAVDSENTDTSADNRAIHRESDWFFDQIVNPLKSSNICYDVQLSWSSDWYGSILFESQRVNAEMIMIPLVTRPSRRERIFNESIWRLLRTAQAPVLIVQPESSTLRKSILAAVNFQSDHSEYQRLNDLIIDRGHWAATNYNADLHIVNAYKNSLNYPDRSKLAIKTKVNTANIHVRAGDPDEVIAKVASEINADLVMLGTRLSSNRWRGNTSEKIITKVKSDILTIN